MLTIYNATNVVVISNDHKIIIDHVERLEIQTQQYKDQPNRNNERHNEEEWGEPLIDLSNRNDIRREQRMNRFNQWYEPHINSSNQDIDTILPERPLKDESIIEDDTYPTPPEQLRQLLDDELNEIEFDISLFCQYCNKNPVQ